MGEELKPCAHCGAAAEPMFRESRTRDWIIACSACPAGMCIDGDLTAAEAAALWNRREREKGV